MGNRGGCPTIHGLRVLQHLLVILLLSSVLPAYHSKCPKPPIIFNFGDSNSDTGGLSAGLGYSFGLPHGRVFFRWPTGRLCDGRLIIDFLCESVHSRYLSPYLEALGSDFSNGANFAIAGSATQPKNTPFSLFIQLQQFLHFRSRSLGLVAQGWKNLINDEGFRRALYTFDIGQNDLTAAFNANISYEEIIGRIPSILSEIRGAIETIYSYGGKNFWIHNTGPLGCLPEKLASNRNTSDFDAYRCLSSFNSAAKAFNDGLSGLFDALTTELKNATIVYTDVFAIKYDLIVNHAKYGFEKPLMACCGFGGPPYNYNKNVTCGNPACQVCPVGPRYISWDGIHYTEAATSIVASKILSGNYSKPPNVKFESFCVA